MPRGPQPGRSEDRLAFSAHLEPLLQESNTLEKRLPVNTSTAEGLNRKLLHTCPPAKGRSRKAVWEIQRSPERRDAHIHESTFDTRDRTSWCQKNRLHQGRSGT